MEEGNIDLHICTYYIKKARKKKKREKYIYDKVHILSFRKQNKTKEKTTSNKLMSKAHENFEFGVFPKREILRFVKFVVSLKDSHNFLCFVFY